MTLLGVTIPQSGSGSGPSSLNIRSSLIIKGGIPAWKLHLLELIKQVPKGNSIKCNRPIVRLSSKFNLKDSSNASKNTEIGQELSISSIDIDKRALYQSRIQSLRLTIGDLSVAENLEKLCDHYFKLDLQQRARDPDTERILSVIINSPEENDSCPNFQKKIRGELEKASNKRKANVVGLKEGSEFGKIYHGILSGKDASKLLSKEGDYLVRNILGEGGYFVSMRFNERIHNFKVLRDAGSEGLYYLEDRKSCYGSVEEMVNEGLRTLFLDLKAGPYLDILTEVAQINKHDSMIWWLSPSSAGSDSPRKGSAVSINALPQNLLGRRRSSVANTMDGRPQTMIGKSLSLETTMGQTTIVPSEKEVEVEADELSQHVFLPGNVPLDKKAPCDVGRCPLRRKMRTLSLEGILSVSNTINPSGKSTLVCKDCGMTIHEACVELLACSDPCVPDLLSLPEIFGCDLTTIVKASANHSPSFVLIKCIQEIEARGLDSEGIYRVSGSQDGILQIQNRFERDRENADITSTVVPDIDAVSGVLKLYLRLLPEPLISRTVFAKFLQDAANSFTLNLEGAKSNLESLPKAHKLCLSVFLKHLSIVAARREENKMSAYNLSSVLAPSLIVPEEMSLSTLKIATDVVDLLIRNWNKLEI